LRVAVLAAFAELMSCWFAIGLALQTRAQRG
jgi:hypothetical protein